jgi:hypothetical protein
MSEKQEIILCIPGPWKDRSALLRALLEAHQGRYIFAGVILHDTETKDSVEVDFEGHNPTMARAFRPSGLDAESLAAIAAHQLTAYLHFPLDLPDQRERLLKYSDVFRKAGGIAIKLESCGLAHSWERWFEWMSSPLSVMHYRAAVVLARGKDGWYSCGMHHFGLPDAVTTTPGKPGGSIVEAFNRYCLIESPALESGHTFSEGPDAPRYRLHWTEDDRFEEGDLFHNSHGIWHLSPVQ